jgi:hypothetical protein
MDPPTAFLDERQVLEQTCGGQRRRRMCAAQLLGIPPARLPGELRARARSSANVSVSFSDPQCTHPAGATSV